MYHVTQATATPGQLSGAFEKVRDPVKSSRSSLFHRASTPVLRRKTQPGIRTAKIHLYHYRCGGAVRVPSERWRALIWINCLNSTVSTSRAKNTKALHLIDPSFLVYMSIKRRIRKLTLWFVKRNVSHNFIISLCKDTSSSLLRIIFSLGAPYKPVYMSIKQIIRKWLFLIDKDLSSFPIDRKKEEKHQKPTENYRKTSRRSGFKYVYI